MADTPPVASAPDVSSSGSSFDWSSLAGLAGIIPSIINFISNRFNNKTQKELQQGAQNWNAEQATIAWNRGLEQWNRENEYNSPAAQMQRLRDAGINPALAYANGAFNQAATSPDAPVSAPARAANTQAFQMDPLTFAQMGLIEAQTRKVNEETTYQNFLNKVEEALANSPLREVSVVNPDGTEDVEIVYGNARVEFQQRLLRSIGLSNSFDAAQLQSLLYDIAVLTGSDLYGNSFGYGIPSDTPNYSSAVAALKGDMETRRVAGAIATLSEKAAQAEKAGKEAYGKWLEENKDKPIVQFMLALQGFVQTLGISIPSFSVANSQSTKLASGFATKSASRFFFGGTR